MVSNIHVLQTACTGLIDDGLCVCSTRCNMKLSLLGTHLSSWGEMNALLGSCMQGWGSQSGDVQMRPP
jgi:hypothetical protein